MGRRPSLISLLFAVSLWLLPASCKTSQPAGPPTSHTPEPEATDANTGQPPADARLADEPPGPRVVEVSLADVGLDASAMDASADPCQDFYQYACGGYMTRTQLPAGRQRISPVDQAAERAVTAVRDLLQRSSASADEPVERALARFHGACMAEDAVEQAGLTGLDEVSAALTALRKDRDKDWTSALLALHRIGIFAGFSLRVEPSPKPGEGQVLVIDGASLGLPSRAHYLSSDDDMKRMRRAYRDHVQAVFAMTGAKKKRARQAAAGVLHIETELARWSATASERRRPAGWFSTVPREQLQRLLPKIDWAVYLRELGRPESDPVQVFSTEYLSNVATFMRKSGAQRFADYLRWRLLDEMTPVLSAQFVAARASFDRQLAGADGPAESGPRWRHCAAVTDRALGPLVARQYVARHFADTERQAATEAVEAIRRGLLERVAGHGWLSQPAQARTRAKLEAMRLDIGRPDSWAPVDLPTWPEDAGLATMALAVRSQSVRAHLARVGTRPAAQPWLSSTHHANGYYQPMENRLVLTAALLQPPVFAARAPRPVQLGSLALLAGHELVHAIDDVGQGYDASGVRSPGWTADDRNGYRQRADCFVAANVGAQPAADKPLVRTHSLREDLADVGGVLSAWQAHQSAASATGSTTLADGLDGDRQFFVSVAQSACEKRAAGAARRIWGGRSIGRKRVNQTLAQVPGFAETFACTADAPMRAQPVCPLW